MPVNREFIGREFPAPATYEVGREHVRRFAEAIGDPSPAYLDAEAARALGHPDVVAPPTFLTVLGFRFAADGPIADPALGLDYSLVVHGEQSFDLHRPVVAGDVLRSTQRVAEIRDAGRNELITTVTEITDPSGVPVATARSTLVSRGTAAPRSAASPSTARARAEAADSAGASPSASGAPGGQVQVGAELPTRAFPLQRVDLVRYCGASGDFNVIHWNERIARSVGLPDVIAHGMLTMAVAGRVVTDWAGDPGAVESYRVRFSRPVVVRDDDRGAELTVAGQVEEVRDGRVVVGLTALVGDAKVLAGARAVVRRTGDRAG